MEGTLALLIPIISVGGFAWMIAISPLGRAFGEPLRGQARGPGDAREREELLAAVEDLRREVAELAERVDFTERLLAKERAADRLGPRREVAR